MKKLMNVFFAVLVAFVAIGLNSGEAEARRLGGGSSFGSERLFSSADRFESDGVSEF